MANSYSEWKKQKQTQAPVTSPAPAQNGTASSYSEWKSRKQTQSPAPVVAPATQTNKQVDMSIMTRSPLAKAMKAGTTESLLTTKPITPKPTAPKEPENEVTWYQQLLNSIGSTAKDVIGTFQNTNQLISDKASDFADKSGITATNQFIQDKTKEFADQSGISTVNNFIGDQINNISDMVATGAEIVGDKISDWRNGISEWWNTNFYNAVNDPYSASAREINKAAMPDNKESAQSEYNRILEEAAALKIETEDIWEKTHNNEYTHDEYMAEMARMKELEAQYYALDMRSKELEKTLPKFDYDKIPSQADFKATAQKYKNNIQNLPEYSPFNYNRTNNIARLTTQAMPDIDPYSTDVSGAMLPYFMSDNEKNIFYYLASDGDNGDQKALDYYEYLASGVLLQRQAEWQQKATAKDAEKNPWSAWGTTILQAPQQAIAGIYLNVQDFFNNPIDTNSPFFSSIRISETVRPISKQEIVGNSPFGGLLFDAASSMGDSFTRLAFSGGIKNLSLLNMGLGAQAATVKDVLDRGGTQDQAMVLGYISCTAEILTEKIPLGILVKSFKVGNAAGIKSFIKGFLKQGVKGIITEAPGEGLSQIIEDKADSFVMGELSKFNINVRRYINEQGMSKEKAEQEASKDAAYNILTSFIVGGIMGFGSNTFSYTSGSVFNRTGGQNQSAASASNNQLTLDAYKKVLEQAIGNAPVEDINTPIVDAVANNQTNPIVQAPDVPVPPMPQPPPAELPLSDQATQANIDTAPPVQTPDASAPITQGTQMPDMIEDAQESASAVTEAPIDGMKTAHEYGKAGLRLTDLENAIGVKANPDIIKAYNEGVQARVGQNKADTKKPLTSGGLRSISDVEAKKFGVNKIAQNHLFTKKQKAAFTALDGLAKATGIHFVVFESPVVNGKQTGANGFYDAKTKTAYIDIFAGYGNEQAIVRTAAHEMTHFLEKESAEEYNAYKDFLLDYYYGKSDTAIAEMIASEIEKAQKNGRTMTESEAMNEVIANASEMMLSDIQGAQQLQKANPKLFEKIKGWLDNLVKALKRAFEGIDAAEPAAKMLKESYETFKQAQDMWLKALPTAQEGATGAIESDTDGVQYSLRTFDDGTRFVDVEANQEEFTGLSTSEMIKKAHEILREKFQGKVVGIDNRAYVNRKTVDEYTHPSKRIADQATYQDKLKASSELDNIIDAGRFIGKEEDGRDGHFHNNVTGGFDYYEVMFKVGNEYYSGIINIANIDGRQLLKDITQIRNVSEDVMGQFGKIPHTQFLRNASMDSISESPTKSNKNLLDTDDVQPSMRNDLDVRIVKGREIDEDSYTSISYDITSKGKVVGAVSMMVDEKSAYVERIDVDEEYRNQGIGENVLRLLASEYDGILVAPDNERAVHLYDRLGKDVTSSSDDIYDQGFGVYQIDAQSRMQYSMRDESTHYDYSKPFAEQVEDWKNGKLPKSDTLIIGKTPELYKQIGLSDIPMVITQGHFEYMFDGKLSSKGDDHQFSEKTIMKLPELIANPVAIIASNDPKYRATSVNVIIEAMSKTGKQGFAAIQIDGLGVLHEKRIDANRVSTVFGNADVVKMLEDAITSTVNQKLGIGNEFDIFYIDKGKAEPLLASQRTKAGWSIKDGFNHSIFDEGSPVNKKNLPQTETRQFKRWFGDWEKHPDKASKVVNADGTPKIVYHGSRSNFTVFNTDKGGQSNSIANIGYWFTESEQGARSFADNTWYGDSDESVVYGVYLNIKNPKIYESVDNRGKIDEIYKKYKPIDAEMTLIDNTYHFEDGRRYHTENYNYDKSKRKHSGFDEWEAFKAIVKKYDAETVQYYTKILSTEALKSVESDAKRYLNLSESREKLGAEIDELRYSDAYEQFKSDIYKIEGKTADDANFGGAGKTLNNPEETLRVYVESLKKEGYDGIIIRNTGYDAIAFGGVNTQYVVFDSTQIKSATDNIGLFDPNNPDIRYSDRSPDAVTDRQLLAEAFDTVAQTPLEKSHLKSYKKRIDELNADNARLNDINAEIRRLSFGTGTRDTGRLTVLRNQQKILQTRIARADKTLLNFERSAPLKRILEVERKNAMTKQREKGKQALQKYKDNAVIRETKETIEKNAKALMDYFAHPNNQKHIPEPIRAILGDFLKRLDFSSKQSLAGKGETRKDIAFMNSLQAVERMLGQVNQYQEGAEAESAFQGFLDLPAGFKETVQSFTDSIRKVIQTSDGTFEINNMDANALKQLNAMMTIIKRAVTSMNDFMTNSAFAHVDDAALDSTIELNSLGKKEKTTAVGDFLNWTNAQPVRVFDRFGKGGKSIFKALAAGQGKLAKNAQKIIDFARDAYLPNEVKEWENDIRTVTVNGAEIKIPVSHIMSLYALNKRRQARGHLYGEGFRIADIKGKSGTLHDDGRIVSESDVRTILSELTPRQMEVADKLQEYMNSVGSDMGNEISMRRFGFKAFTEKNYFPIEVDKGRLAATPEQQYGNGLYRLLNISATKELTEGANNRLMVYSIFDVFTGHMSDMAQYNALALPVLDAVKWLNYRTSTKLKTGQKITETMHDSIRNAYGNKAYSYVVNFLRDLNGTQMVSRNETAFLKLTRNYNFAQVGANLSTVLLQPLSIIRAANVISPKYLLMGLKKSQSIKANMREMEEKSGIAAWKRMGFYDVNLSRGLGDLIKGENGIIDKLKSGSLKGAETADRLTWGTMWQAVKYEIEAKHPNLTIGSDEYFAAVNERFDEVIYYTQVVDSMLTRSDYMRSGNFAAKFTSSFMSEPTTTYNMLMAAKDNFVADTRKGMSTSAAFNKHKGAILKTVGVFAISRVMEAVVRGIMTAARDDDDYETFTQKVKDGIYDGIIDNLVPFDLLPIVSQLWEEAKPLFGLDGFETELTVFQFIRYLIDGKEIIEKKLTGESTKYTDFGAIYKLLQSASSFTGMPFASFTRDATSMWNTIIGERAPSLKIKTYEDTKTKGYQALYDSLSDGDKAQENIIRKQLKLNGVSQDEITKGIYSNIRDSYKSGLIDSTTAIKQLTAYGGKDTNTAYWMVDEWQYEGPENYTKFASFIDAVRTGKNLSTEIARHKKYTVSTKTPITQTLASQITSAFKDEYIQLYKTNRSAASALKSKLLNAYAALGYDRAKKEKDIAAWVK